MVLPCESDGLSARQRRARQPVLAALERNGAATRAELSRLTGLSRSAVSDCVASLLADGTLTESPLDVVGNSGRGRRPRTVSLKRPEGLLLGLDLGHAHVTAALGTSDGEILADSSAEVDVDVNPERALDLAAELADQVLRDGGHHRSDVLGVGAGIPGPIDSRTQILRAPTILADWVGLDPAAELRRRLNRPVVVANDAEMGAQGERAFGAARGIDDFLYVKASHGIGAGLVLAGRAYRGAIGIAGEIGHTPLPGASEWCRCGSRGCLETVVSIGAVRRRLAHVLTTANSAVTEETMPPLADLANHQAAARVLTEAGRTIGRVLANLVNCLNPAAIILGGELGAAGPPFVDGVADSVNRYAQPAAADTAQVLAGQLGARAELLGSLASAARTFLGASARSGSPIA